METQNPRGRTGRARRGAPGALPAVTAAAEPRARLAACAERRGWALRFPSQKSDLSPHGCFVGPEVEMNGAEGPRTGLPSSRPGWGTSPAVGGGIFLPPLTERKSRRRARVYHAVPMSEHFSLCVRFVFPGPKQFLMYYILPA